MFYIFNNKKILQGWCDSAPNIDDLEKRNEFIIETESRMITAENAFTSGCEVFSDFTYKPIQPTEFHIWNGSEWLDPRSEEEKLAYKRSQYPSLIRYQFLRCLLENGYKSSNIEAQILTIEDEFTRELTLLGFKEATNFVRTDESVIAIQSILNLDDEKVDAMWEYALTL